MTVRFRARHLQQTLADHIEAHLVSLGWTANPPPWGIAPITFREVEPEQVVELKPTIVSTLVENEGNKDLAQLGGGLWGIDYNVFFDVYAEKASIALSLCGDIRDAIDNAVLVLQDYSGAGGPVPVTGSEIEFEDVETMKGKGGGSTTAPDLKQAWRTVAALVHLTLSEE